MTPSFVVVTLKDGFGVPQVKLVTGIKFLRILKKEGLVPSIPEVLYFLVKKAKSMRKHLVKNRKDRVSKSVSSSLEAAFTALRGTADASSSCLPTGSTSLLRPRLELVTPLFNDVRINFLWAIQTKNAIQTFLCGGSKLPFGREGAVPFRESLILLRMRRYSRPCLVHLLLGENVEHSLSGMKGNSLS